MEWKAQPLPVKRRLFSERDDDSSEEDSDVDTLVDTQENLTFENELLLLLLQALPQMLKPEKKTELLAICLDIYDRHRMPRDGVQTVRAKKLN
jgi:hypothetical protein